MIAPTASIEITDPRQRLAFIPELFFTPQGDQLVASRFRYIASMKEVSGVTLPFRVVSAVELTDGLRTVLPARPGIWYRRKGVSRDHAGKLLRC